MQSLICTLRRRIPRKGIAHLALIGLFLAFQFVYGSGQVFTVRAIAPTTPGFCSTEANIYGNFTSAGIPDNDPAGIDRPATVSGIGNYLWDIDVRLNITHPVSNQLDIWLTSPSGTVVTLTTDNGGNNANVFSPTTFDDDADPGNNTSNIGSTPGNSARVNDTAYGSAKSQLTPEEPLAAFVGEDPNGVWTLTIADDTAGNTGTINNWSFTIYHLNGSIRTSSTTFSNNSFQTISDRGTPTVTSTITPSGLSNVITKVTVTTTIVHDFNLDLDIALTSPGGTAVTLTSNNGGGGSNAFNGTIWNDDADPGNGLNPNRVADTTYRVSQPKTTLTPEEPLGAFMGESPNGTWTLTIIDDSDLAGGGLINWSITITTGDCSTDVGVTKALSTAGPYYAGGLVQYTITVSNAGTSPTTLIFMRDTLPTNLTFVSIVTPNGWSCGTPPVGSTGFISCGNASLGAGVNSVFIINTRIKLDVAKDTVISNIASIQADNDWTTNNNATPPVNFTTDIGADLSISKTDGQTSDTPGTTITYTITASNAGPSNAPSVTVTDTLPNTLTGATWTCVGAGDGTCAASGSGNINDATVNLPVGGSVTYTLTATIAANATGTLSNIASVSSTVDITSGNNQAEDTTDIIYQADLSVTKTAGSPTTVQGANITYTIKVNNAGPNTAPVTLTDVIPTGTTLQSFTAPNGWFCTTPNVGASGTVTCNTNLFAVGEETFTLVVKVDLNAVGGSTISNTAEITSTADTSTGNDSQQADVTVGSPLLSSWAQPANLIQLNGLVGTTPTINIAVSNTGATGTNLNVTVSTPPGSPFAVTNTPLNVAAGAQAFYSVSCAANGTPASGSYKITTNEPGSPTYTYNLSCSSSADTLGVFRPAAAFFHLRYSNTSGPANHSVAVGLGTDRPIVGDWNNDSADTVGVFRPSTGQFFLRDTNQVGGATAYTFALGAVGDIPLAGDFNGDGADDVGFFRPSTGQFLFRYTKSAGTFDAVIRFGVSTDIPVVGDWDGDGKDTPGVYRGGLFYLTNRSTSTTAPAPINVTVRYGLAADIPVVGDWDANGTVTVGVYRGNAFLLRNSNTAGPVDAFVYFGLSGDKPVVGNWLKPGAVLPIRPPQQPTAPTFTPKQ